MVSGPGMDKKTTCVDGPCFGAPIHFCRPCSASLNQGPREITGQTKKLRPRGGDPETALHHTGISGQVVSVRLACPMNPFAGLRAATQPKPRFAGALFF